MSFRTLGYAVYVRRVPMSVRDKYQVFKRPAPRMVMVEPRCANEGMNVILNSPSPPVTVKVGVG